MLKVEDSLRTGKRITAPWLPGTCIIQGTIPEEDQIMLVLALESTGESIVRKVTAEQITTLKEVTNSDASGDAHLFRLGIEALRLGFAHSYDPYFALSVSRVDPLPHQLEAVYMHMMKQPRIRFLLGDDAGAGKTIMAGLLIREMRLRGLADRILIIAPANLSYQWRRELKDLFGEQFEIIRGQDVTDTYASNPWMKNDMCIVSRDWAKREDVFKSFEEAAPWDFVIIDEAHGMATSNPDKNPSQRFKLAKMISSHTDHLLMMTATPHNGDKVRFLHFLSLLDDDVYSDPESLELAIKNKEAPFYLRRLKESMRNFPTEEYPQGEPLFKRRTVSTVGFDIDGDEYKLYQELTNYLQHIGQIARKLKGSRAYAIGFMMALYQRRLASSPHALFRSLERRRERLRGILDGTWQPPKKKKKRFDKEMADELDDETLGVQHEEEEDAQISEYDKQQAREELVILNPLIDRTQHLVDTGTTAKWRELKRMLDTGEAFDTETDRKLLIFTEHKDTLNWLNEKLSKEYKTVVIHGGMKPGARDRENTRLWAEQQFRDKDGAQIMIATEAAGEGINLQFCWRMVNWDVPWNPARLEQRMGRIHRYKQKHDVIAFNLIAINTREGAVLEALQVKIKEIRGALDPDNEGKIFDVVGSVVPPNMVENMMKRVYDQELTKDEAVEEVRSEISEEKFKDIINHTLESLASRELNMGIVKQYNAEAKIRRLVPEVLRDFFLTSAEKVFAQAVKRNGEDYSWKTPRAIMSMRKDLLPLGDLGKEYKAFTFYKEALEQRSHLEWVTPGHPLYEGVRRHTLKKGKPHLDAGARFYDPDGGPERWIQVFKYKMVDGNGIIVDEQLLVVEISKDEENGYKMAIRPPTVFIDLVPDERNKDPIPPLPEDSLLGHIQSYADKYLSGEEGVAARISGERKEKANIVRSHVQASLQALIQKEMQKFEKYDREQDKRLCMDRVSDYEDRLYKREEELIKQGEVVIQQNVPMALAHITPLPDDYFGATEQDVTKSKTHKLKKNTEAEHAAIKFVTNWELANGAARVESREDDGAGYDLESYDNQENLLRFIEVKGKTTDDDGILTPNEWSTAERLRGDYWLYVIEDALSTPQLHRIQDPYNKLNPTPQTKIERYFFNMNEIRQNAAKHKPRITGGKP